MLVVNNFTKTILLNLFFCFFLVFPTLYTAPETSHSNGHDEPEVESEPEKEPEIKVCKILKRPASTPSMQFAAETAETSGNNLDENLKKREEEYAKVRLRILGSTGMEENNVSWFLFK